MDQVTDVLDFATKNPDYWEDLLTGSDYPPELLDDEVRALDAARAHIESLVVDLLHSTGTLFAEHLGKSRIAQPRFKKASTTKNRRVQMPAPTGLESEIYRVEFLLQSNDKGTAIELFPAVVVKKGSMDSLRKSLTTKQLEHTVDDYHVYAPGIPIAKGSRLADIAAAAAGRAADMIDALSPSIGTATVSGPPAVPPSPDASSPIAVPEAPSGPVNS